MFFFFSGVTTEQTQDLPHDTSLQCLRVSKCGLLRGVDDLLHGSRGSFLLPSATDKGSKITSHQRSKPTNATITDATSLNPAGVITIQTCLCGILAGINSPDLVAGGVWENTPACPNPWWLRLQHSCSFDRLQLPIGPIATPRMGTEMVVNKSMEPMVPY